MTGKNITKKNDLAMREHLSMKMAELLLDVVPKSMQLLREEMRIGRGEHLTVPQFRVLASVNRGATNNKMIADILGVSEAAISRMIDTLVENGMLIKDIDSTDRRHSKIALSQEGKKLYAVIRNDAKKRMKNKIDRINEKHIAQIINGLELLQENLGLLKFDEQDSKKDTAGIVWH